MRILITGGAGFLGTALVKQLAKKTSNQICVFDIFTHGFPKKFPKKKNISSRIGGNIRNYYDIRRAFEQFRPDVIIHLADYITRPEAVGEFRTCAEVNYAGTANLLDACVSLGTNLNKLVFVSSHAVSHPASHYGISKRAAENLTLSLANTFDFNAVVLRFAEIYGHSDSFTSFSQVNFLVDNMLQNSNNIAVYGAANKQDYIYIDDAVRMFELVLEKKEVPASPVEVGSGETITTKNLIKRLKILIDFDKQFKYLISPKVITADSVTNPKLARDFYDFQYKISLDEGLQELIKKRRKDLR